MIPVLILTLSLLPLLILTPAVFGFAWWLDRQPRRDPLTTGLRRLPGSSLEIRLEKEREKVLDRMLWSLSTGLVVAFMILTKRLPKTGIDWHTLDTIYLLIGLTVSAILSWRIVRRMPGLRKMKQGIRAEQAAAQELAEVLAGRNRIIHDVQAQDFNIDHVVITPGGIFAVETKSRLKPAAGQGAEAVKVIYDGKCLKFPGWTETAPIEQARRQAQLAGPPSASRNRRASAGVSGPRPARLVRGKRRPHHRRDGPCHQPQELRLAVRQTRRRPRRRRAAARHHRGRQACRRTGQGLILRNPSRCCACKSISGV